MMSSSDPPRHPHRWAYAYVHIHRPHTTHYSIYTLTDHLTWSVIQRRYLPPELFLQNEILGKFRTERTTIIALVNAAGGLEALCCFFSCLPCNDPLELLWWFPKTPQRTICNSMAGRELTSPSAWQLLNDCMGTSKNATEVIRLDNDAQKGAFIGEIRGVHSTGSHQGYMEEKGGK